MLFLLSQKWRTLLQPVHEEDFAEDSADEVVDEAEVADAVVETRTPPRLGAH